jgi:hypothetical protein
MQSIIEKSARLRFRSGNYRPGDRPSLSIAEDMTIMLMVPNDDGLVIPAVTNTVTRIVQHLYVFHFNAVRSAMQPLSSFNDAAISLI